jgi:uncharacterized OB-fold protein
MLHGLPRPVRDEDTTPFWEGCDRGQLLIQRSTRSHEYRWPPGPASQPGGEDVTEWVQVAGRGTVYSWVVVRVALIDALTGQTPYAVGLIDLAEGVRIVSTISGCSVDDIEAGMPVHVIFADDDGPATYFSFTPD